MALAQVLKVFTKERLFYQHLNNQNQHFADRINERLETSEVSVIKAVDKVPRANASGQLEYDLKGNVEGNATTATTATTANTANVATLAEAAKGDTRFWVSGVMSYSTTPIAGALVGMHFARFVPDNKYLKLKKACYYAYNSNCRLYIDTEIGELLSERLWTSSSNLGEENPDIKVSSYNNGFLKIYIGFIGSATIGDGWWLEFAIE